MFQDLPFCNKIELRKYQIHGIDAISKNNGKERRSINT